MSKGIGQTWSDSQDRAWRKTFTRENKEGENKLRHKLRHNSAAELVREEKLRMEIKGEKSKQDKREMYFQALKDAQPINTYRKYGGKKKVWRPALAELKYRAGVWLSEKSVVWFVASLYVLCFTGAFKKHILATYHRGTLEVAEFFGWAWDLRDGKRIKEAPPPHSTVWK